MADRELLIDFDFLFTSPWRWKQQGHLKHWYLTPPHSITNQKTETRVFNDINAKTRVYFRICGWKSSNHQICRALPDTQTVITHICIDLY